MDKGAARSRKRSNPISKPIVALPTATPSRLPPTFIRKERPPRPSSSKIPQKPGPPDDPNAYKPKAIRNSTALIYSDSPFPIPPPEDLTKTVRRIDLVGSGVKDVSWLKECGEVTWLSLAGCEIETGWEEVGGLGDLSVLNISGCGLTTLPKSLKSLGKLKAVVAMNNDWTSLDDEVIASWTDLNSLIVSHSPNLITLSDSLSTLHQLSKLTFSHCPRLTSSLPDLSPLPLLRDVRMNNLPLLTFLPAHITTWGTGDMSLAQPSKTKNASLRDLGDGLEGLDLGNCSLSYDSIAPLFGLISKPTKSKTNISWPHLRSLTLASNPLTITHPNYVDLLQTSDQLPNLQIIDAKRVVERKRKGEVQVSKHDRRQQVKLERRAKPTGANVVGEGTMRSWGADKAKSEAEGVGEKKEKKQKRSAEEVETEADRAVKPPKKAKVAEKKTKHRSEKTLASEPIKPRPAPAQPAPPAKPVATETKADPTAVVTKAKVSRNETSVVGVVEVGSASGKKDKKKDKSGGVDLAQMFAKKVDDGLGVGGW
ncbi:hypothetical protein P7C73_g2401, partial [Tremellales sp. Uapishka_1]